MIDVNNISKMSTLIFGREAKHEVLGNYIKCYIGYAVDYNTRYNASSGGVVTALLMYLLEEGIIDGALVVRMSKKDPLEPEVFIAKNPNEVASAKGSKYCPVPMNIGLREILNTPGKFAVVGLPCHIHGIRKFELINKKLKDKIFIRLGLFCSNTASFLGTEYFLKWWGVNREEIRGIKYRGMGWPGMITVLLRRGKLLIPRGPIEKSFSRKTLFYSAFHYDFMPPRCLLCIDITCQLADVSFADPWLPEILEKERVGKTLIVSRSELGDRMLREAASHGRIQLSEIRPLNVLRAGNIHYKRQIYRHLWVLSLFNRSFPAHIIKERGKNPIRLLEALLYLPSLYSRKKYLWPMIYIASFYRAIALSIASKILYSIAKSVNS